MTKINATFILILAALRTTSWAFEFIQQPGKRLEVLEGSAIRLMYKASAYWEHCTFKVGFCGQFFMNPYLKKLLARNFDQIGSNAHSIHAFVVHNNINLL